MKTQNDNSVKPEVGNSTKPLLSSRLLKFRACLKNSSEIYEVMSFCKEYVKIYTDITEKGYTKLSIDNFEPLMQFTGLIDKNGTEIYEGDLIKRVIGYQGNENISFDLISFHGAHFSATRFSPDLRTEGFLENWTFHTMEVIGNYYQNPELLQTTS